MSEQEWIGQLERAGRRIDSLQAERDRLAAELELLTAGFRPASEALVDEITRHAETRREVDGLRGRLNVLAGILTRIAVRIGADQAPRERLADIVDALMDVVEDQRCGCTDGYDMPADNCKDECFAAHWRNAVTRVLERHSEQRDGGAK